MNVVDSRGESLNAIRDRYELLRAEVQTRRRKHPTAGSIAPAWRRPGALASRTTLTPSCSGMFVQAGAAIR
jgi:hypothetical protein